MDIEIPEKVSDEEMQKDTQKKDKKKDSLTKVSERLKKVEDRLDLVMNFTASSFYTASGVAYSTGPWWMGVGLTIAGMASAYIESIIRQLKEKYGVSVSQVRKKEGGLRKAMTTLKSR